ncbi:MAG: hypothetical protein GW827_13895 [Flavobacteriales bacterium]|nr:hypothetical protein [Flavobacteriales bacterium]
MKLSKEEKKFWQRYYRIEKLADISSEMKGIVSIDSDLDDDYLFYLTSRVPIIRAFDLENTNITDEGIKLISKVKHVEKLELKDSRQITKNCLPYINTLKELVLLNLMKTSITLNDVMLLNELHNLKELYISSDKDEDYHFEKIMQIKDILPNCIVYVNYETLE